MPKHVAIYITNTDDKETLINRIVSGNLIKHCNGLKPAIFSEKTLNTFLLEEMRHGNYILKTQYENVLEKSSEGERKKALLNFLINTNPEFIILDNVFGNLDVETQENIQKSIKNLGNKIPIVQITNRKNEIFDFIETIFQLSENQLFEVSVKNIKSAQNLFVKALPPPYQDNLKKFSTLVKFNKVSVSFGNRCILNEINFEIKQGEFWQLIGPNGSGKSTILSLITGDNPKAYQQDITLFGVKKGSGESIWDIKQKIGYFSSELTRGFTRPDSIESMILSGFYDSVGLYKIPSDRQILLVKQWLRLLNLDHLKESCFLDLSLGHKHLVLIARAMIKHPPLLILDEPTNGLDDADVLLFTQLINKIANESETAILYVSHRKEPQITPNFIFELTPKSKGSTGKQIMLK